MNYFKKIVRFAYPYKKYAFLNVLFNILYAIFNVLSVLAFIPVLNILFKQENKILTKPVYTGIQNIGVYTKDNFYYFISQKIELEGTVSTLLFICVITFGLFFLKNLFRYLASYVLVFLRNGTVKDLRDALYHKIVELPISYFNKKKKGDIIARMTTDVQEIEISFLTSLESHCKRALNGCYFINNDANY